MNPSPRSRIRDDVLADYVEPRPDLPARVLRAVSDASARPVAQRGGRVVLQTLTVVMAALVVAIALVGVRVSRGELVLPAGLPFGGLHPPAASYSIVDSQFLSADVGWIVAQLQEHSGPTVLMTTTDGGKTWHEQLRFADGSAGWGGLRFWSAREGELTWSVPSTLPGSKVPGAPGSMSHVPQIYQTRDGGAHWRVVDRAIDWSPSFGSFFLSRQEGWRLIGTQARKATLQHTEDGGAHWTMVATVPVGGALTFRDSLNGWLTFAQSPSFGWDASGKPIPSEQPPALIYVTRDGGHSWSPQELPLPTTAAANVVRVESPVFFGKGDGVLPFEIIQRPPTSRTLPGQAVPRPWMESYVLQTHDGGEHWGKPVLTPGGMQQGSALFFDARHWLLSQGPSLKETFDAGTTWTSRRVLADGLEFHFAPWSYIDSKVIWSQVGAHRLVRSTDGGAHWTAVTPPAIK